MHKLTKTRIMLILISILSLFLSLWGVNWGLPSRERMELLPSVPIEEMSQKWTKMKAQETPLLLIAGGEEPVLDMLRTIRRFSLYTHDSDEYYPIMAIARMKPAEFDFNPHTYLYGGAFLYPIALLIKISSMIGYVDISQGIDYFLTHPEEIAKLYLIGRILVALSAVGSVFMLYLIGSYAFSQRIGLLAGLFFAITPSTIIWSHVLKPHLYAVLPALVSFYFSLKILKEGKFKHYLLAGMMAGFATGAALTYSVVVISLFIAYIFHSLESGRWRFHWLFLSGFSALAIFFITNPYWILTWQEVIQEISPRSRLCSLSLMPKAWFSYLTLALPLGLKWPMFLIAIAGLVYLLVETFHKDKIAILFLGTIIPTFLLTASFRPEDTLFTLRFGLFLISLLSIIIANFVSKTAIYLSKRSGWLTVGFTFIIGLICVYTFLYAFSYLLNFHIDSSSENTRIRAGKWINENLPVGSSVLLSGVAAPFTTPPFRFDLYKISLDLKNENATKYVVSAYGQCPLKNITNYKIIKKFESVKTILGLKFEDQFYFNNHDVYIFKRNQ